MKKQTKLGLLTLIMLIAVLLLTGCTSNLVNNDEKENSLEGLAVYTEEETTDYKVFDKFEGVTFKYPSNYLSVGKDNNPIYMDPEVQGASVNILESTIPSVFSFEGYVDASIPGIKQQMDIAGEIKTEYINLNGRKAAKLDYVAKSTTGNIKVTQVLIEKEEKAFILTLGSLEKDAEKVQSTFDKIIKSFK